jgi:hypothetical protein
LRNESFRVISYHNRHPLPSSGYHYASSPLELARTVDVLVVATTGGKDDEKLVGSEELVALGPEGYLINIARGSVVDQDALVELLTGGRLAGAGLDVFLHEPDVPSQLRELDNVVLLPHVGQCHHADARGYVGFGPAEPRSVPYQPHPDDAGCGAGQVNARCGCETCSGVEVFGLEHPCLLFQVVDDRVEQVGCRRIRGINRVMRRADGSHDGIDAGRHDVHEFRCAALAGGNGGHGRRSDDGVGAAVRNGVKGPHSFGDRVTCFACAVDNLVELQVKVAEVGSDQVPMSLFALKMQLDEVDEDLLQVLNQVLGGVKLVHLVDTATIRPN